MKNIQIIIEDVIMYVQSSSNSTSNDNDILLMKFLMYLDRVRICSKVFANSSYGDRFAKSTYVTNDGKQTMYLMPDDH